MFNNIFITLYNTSQVSAKPGHGLRLRLKIRLSHGEVRQQKSQLVLYLIMQQLWPYTHLYFAIT